MTLSPTIASDARALILLGTTEPVEVPRRLKAGGLTAELERGNLRNICWHGFEIIRAIGFVIRDTNWGTLAPEIGGLAVEEGADAFRVSYSAILAEADGAFAYGAEIRGNADGTLAFRATGLSDAGFTTCRTGFVVLHPLEGVVGRDVDVVHSDGSRERTKFPLLIDPFPPATNIRELVHSPATGLRVAVRFTGDVFEMEDHRNWTDASFKTYVRPLSWGYPYRIESGTTIEQSVSVTLAGPAPPLLKDGAPELSLGAVTGKVPGVGMFLPRKLPDNRALAAAIAAVRPAYLVGRLDFRDEGAIATGAGLVRLARVADCPLELELVIPGIDPPAELSVLAAGLRDATLAGVFVIPQRDLKSRPAGTVPAGEASPGAILAAARLAFPTARIGGGMPCGFPELNRNRPASGIDFVTHATQATYHAADDRSVMETLEALPHVIASTRAIVGGIPYRLGPITIGLPEDATAGTPAANPDQRRVAMAENDPRQRGLFAPAFALGYAAVAARAGVAWLSLASPLGMFGAFDADGTPRPLSAVVAALSGLSGAQLVHSEVRGANHVASLAAQTPDGLVLWLANLSPAPVGVALPGAAFTSARMIDAAALAARSVAQIEARRWTGGSVTLDAYAICCLTSDRLQ